MKHGIKFCGRSFSRGAAMLIALLVFFLAALSGTVALTMAASNAGRYTHEKDDQQAYLSVVSAANLILSRLEGITVIYRGKGPGVDPREDGQVDVIYEKSKGDLFLNDANFENALRSVGLPTAASTPSAPVAFTLSSAAHSEMGMVYVSLEISGSDFLFRLYHVNGSARNYQMTLDVSCVLQSGYQQNSDNKYFERPMKFETESAKFTVEVNVLAGGTEGSGGTGGSGGTEG